MHELAIAQSIVDMVEETAAGRRVLRIIVEVGSQSCVSSVISCALRSARSCSCSELSNVEA